MNTRPTQSQSTTQQSGALSGTANSAALSGTQHSQVTHGSSVTQHDSQVTTIVQQIDAQGPVVVDRISTQFADVACSDENARKIVQALHGGTAVTLNANGKTATFTPTGNLGYGEAYIAMALAAEALRAAGVSGCATPEQWQAVLMGGPLNAAGTSQTSTSSSATASSSSNFPGILTLRTQGQGWGQIAKTTNVQLGQVMSSARSSFKIDSDKESNLSPTGRSSAEINESRAKDTRNESSTATSGSDSSTPVTSGLGTSSSRSSTSDFSSDSDKEKDKNKDKSDKKSGHSSSDNSSGGASASDASSNSASESSSKRSNSDR